MMEAAGWKCRNCGRGGRLTLDHIVPRSRGGTDAQANLRVLCGECNSKKADKMPDEVPEELWVRCTRCRAKGVLDRPFGKRCANCSGTGRVQAGKAQLRLSRAKNALTR